MWLPQTAQIKTDLRPESKKRFKFSYWRLMNKEMSVAWKLASAEKSNVNACLAKRAK